MGDESNNNLFSFSAQNYLPSKPQSLTIGFLNQSISEIQSQVTELENKVLRSILEPKTEKLRED
jgi:hypothetical protein